MHKVVVDDKVFYARDQMLLSELLMQEKQPMEHPCAGSGHCKKCTVLVDTEPQLSCQYKITRDISVTLPTQNQIESITGVPVIADASSDALCYVLDVGTTTLALALVSKTDSRILGVKTQTNPQRIYGADVMSRIDYCQRHGVLALQKILIEEINQMISSFGLVTQTELYVAGNTTMLHLLWGVDCTSMGHAPYTPVFLDRREGDAHALGILGVTRVVALPGIAAFVGADLVAGLHAVGLPHSKKYRILLDLGTNAEMILFSAEHAMCTAAAAGPCFEGANISCGMSATEGAICAYSLDSLQTIGNGVQKGICGTGLLDIIATLRTRGVIDETGYMECERFDLGNYVYLDQADVRQFQLAKSAICAAIQTMLILEGITAAEVETLYISGGFSAKFNVKNAVQVGLIPAEFAHKTACIYNSSLSGCIRYIQEENMLFDYLKRARYVDLSQNLDFSNLFVQNMML